jgi:hypothetical protein
MGDIPKKAMKKACNHKKHQLAKQTLPNIQLATKLAPVAAMSLLPEGIRNAVMDLRTALVVQREWQCNQ